MKKYRHSPDRLIDELNTKIIGYHNYYCVATRVNIEFSEIAFKLSKLTYNKLKNLANIGNHKECKSKFITEKYLKSNNFKKYKIKEKVLIPIGYVQHKPLMNYSQELNIYSPKGREHIGYQKLMLEYLVREIYNNSDKRLPTELVDNSISRISAQMGICAISGEFTYDGEIHHIIPTGKGGTHTYSNLIYVDKAVYFLLNSNDLEKCKELLKVMKGNAKTNPEKIIHDINKFRKKADRLPVEITL
jgi:5-methylcytosine-specific restriction endonuclease McrA